MTEDLKNAILAVDGVTDVFPARHLLQRLPGKAAALLHGNSAGTVDEPGVDPRTDGGRLEAVVRIGVSSDARTPDVVRAVAAAVRNHLGRADMAVKVTAVRIAPAS